MNRFTKQLPALLSRTDVVLELRDARLPLTSINHNLESESECPFWLPFFSTWRYLYPSIREVVSYGQRFSHACYAHHLAGRMMEAPESEILFTEAAQAITFQGGWVTVMTNHLLARSDTKMESGTGSRSFHDCIRVSWPHFPNGTRV